MNRLATIGFSVLLSLTACSVYQSKSYSPTPALRAYQVVQSLQDSLRSLSSTEGGEHNLGLNLVWSCPNGNFRGWEDERVLRVQGIRYAASQRYAPPKAYQYPEGIVWATKPAPVAIQGRSASEEYISGMNYNLVAQSESPQYLSICLPKGLKPNEKVPVMVYIHGGSYEHGGADNKAYDPELLVAEHRLIVVNIQYRLGVLGYLRDVSGQPANLGILDQIEALRWVQRNIQYFGGNPHEVTIFGESAGASAVEHLLVAHGAEGLFRRAIIQSSPFGTMPGRERMTKQMLRDFNQHSSSISVDEIRKAQKELTAGIKERGNPKYMYFAPQYGVYPLPKEEELNAAWHRACDRVDVLVGATDREASLFVGNNKFISRLGSMWLTRPVIEALIRQKSKQIFIKGAEGFYQRYRSCRGNMYHYHLTWGKGEGFVAAAHTTDLTLLFGAHLYEGSPMLLGKSVEEVELQGRQLRQIWADFAKTGRVQRGEIKGLIRIK